MKTDSVELQSHPPQTLAIHTQELTKSFGNRFALKEINLEVEQGEFVVIFGPNGAGKTTLLKILNTTMKPSSGRVLIDGFNLKDNTEEIRRRIGALTHQTFLYSNLTAYENLDFYCRMYDTPERKNRIQQVLAMVNMTSRTHDRVNILSRGMRQRLAIARTLLHQPTIMLLDEPETGLDQQGISILWKTLKTKGDGKRTIVLTTHNLERGFEMGDRLLILNEGKFVFEISKQAIDIKGLKEAYQQSTRTGA